MDPATYRTARGGTIFFEEQRFTSTRVWFLVLLAAAGAWINFVYHAGFGDPAPVCAADRTASWMLLVLVGILMPLLFRALRLECELHSDRLHIHYRPLYRRAIMLDQIARCHARTYRPIREYGGWGIRWGGRGSVAYNVWGNQGVQLELKDGKRVLIGSQRAEAFARAVRDTAGLRPEE